MILLQITLPNDMTKISTESLMTDFLSMDFMQKEIIAILMRKIKTLAMEEYAFWNCHLRHSPLALL